MTAEYLETSSRNMYEVASWQSLQLCVHLIFATVFLFLLAIVKIVEKSLCCIQVGWFRVDGPCKLGELKSTRSLLIFILIVDETC